MSSIPLSVLDQSPVRQGGTAADAINETLELARRCEQWEYKRYWLAEHHTSGGLAGCSPEVLLSRLGAETQSIRMEMTEKFALDELMVVTITYDFEARCRSYELLAEAWAT